MQHPETPNILINCVMYHGYYKTQVLKRKLIFSSFHIKVKRKTMWKLQIKREITDSPVT